jgi:glycosyltransferase involved in cell wall biosynthesis
MRVTVVHRFFWPDAPPYARILRSIAERWAGVGHEVDVITAQPGYNARGRLPRRARRETVGSLVVQRVPTVPEQGRGARQAINLLVFPLMVGARLVRSPRPDVVMCSTAPQVTLGAVVSWVARRRGAAFIYHCMDLHPEIGVLSGEFAHPIVRRTLARLDLATMRRADHVVVLSEDMRTAVLDRDPSLADRVVVLNNFSLPDDGGDAASPLPEPAPGVLRVVFTGNLGRFQGLPAFVHALNHVSPGTPVELVFMGEGKARADVEQAAAGLPAQSPHRVLLLPHGEVASAKALMRSAHVGVVSLVPDVVRFAYPSKTATYAEQGLPLLVVCEPEAELARTVVDRGLGWAASPGDVGAIAAGFTAASAELGTDAMTLRRQRVREHAERSFSEGVALDRWEDLLTGVRAREGKVGPG